jgi:hypothetical protein
MMTEVGRDTAFELEMRPAKPSSTVDVRKEEMMKIARVYPQDEMGKRRPARTTAHRWDCTLKGVGWMAGGVAVFSLMATALALFANRALARGHVAHALLGFFLGDWLFALAIMSSVLALLWLFIRARTVCRVPAP